MNVRDLMCKLVILWIVGQVLGGVLALALMAWIVFGGQS